MLKRTVYYILITLGFFLFIGQSCNNRPYTFKVKTEFMRKFIPEDRTERDSLILITQNKRVIRSDRINLQQLSDISITDKTLTGSGVLPYEGFISLSFLNDGKSTEGFSSGFSGDKSWLDSHLNNLAVVSKIFWIEHAPSEYDYTPSACSLNFEIPYEIEGGLNPVYKFSSGSSYLAEIKGEDDFIPWHHPGIINPDNIDFNCISNDNMCFDMQSLTRILFNSFSTSIRGAVQGIPQFSIPIANIPVARAELGGNGNDGDFILRFIPQTQFNERGNVSDRNNPPIRMQGIAFLFEGIINIVTPQVAGRSITYASLKVYIPIFLFFDRREAIRDFDIEIQPLQDIVNGVENPFGLEKIVVLSNTPFNILGNETATRVRDAMVDGMRNLRNDPQMNSLALVTNAGLSIGVNKYLKADRRITDYTAYDIITVPARNCDNTMPLCFEYNGIFSTQVQPEDGNHIPIKTFILER